MEQMINTATDFTTILYGQAGLAVIVAFIVGAVKKQWPNAHKWIYMTVAAVGSAVAAAAAFVVYTIQWSWLLWLGLAGATLGFQLLQQNEAWPQLKKFILWLLELIEDWLNSRKGKGD